jgi:hypothetical protein
MANQIKQFFNIDAVYSRILYTMRTTGRYVISTTLGEAVRAFVPHVLPPAKPTLALDGYAQANREAELALARLSGVSGLVPSVDWLLYSAIRKEALLTTQIEGTQATLTDLLDDEAGFVVRNTDDVEEVTNYLRAFRAVQEQLRNPAGLPLSVRLLCDAHRLPSTCPRYWRMWSASFTMRPARCRRWSRRRWSTPSLKPSTRFWTAMAASGGS